MKFPQKLKIGQKNKGRWPATTHDKSEKGLAIPGFARMSYSVKLP
jgi:hypothetical protein